MLGSGKQLMYVHFDLPLSAGAAQAFKPESVLCALLNWYKQDGRGSVKGQGDEYGS